MPRRNNPINNTQHRTTDVRPSCFNKNKYNSKKHAEEAAEAQMRTSLTLELAVYKCNDCTGWHLTRQTEG